MSNNAEPSSWEAHIAKDEAERKPFLTVRSAEGKRSSDAHRIDSEQVADTRRIATVARDAISCHPHSERMDGQALADAARHNTGTTGDDRMDIACFIGRDIMPNLWKALEAADRILASKWLEETIAAAKAEALTEATRIALETGGYLTTPCADVRTAIAKRLQDRAAEYREATA